MSIIEKLKKNKVVRWVALAGAGLGCSLSPPAYAKKPEPTPYADVIQKENSQTNLKLPKDYNNRLWTEPLEDPKKGKLEEKVDENPMLDYNLAVGEEKRKENFGNVEGYVELSDLFNNQVDFKSMPANGTSTNYADIALNSVIAYTLTLGLHEVGHLAIGSLVGYRDGKIEGPGEGCVLSTRLRRNSPTTEKELAFASGGFIFTTAANTAMETLLATNSVPARMRPLAATTALFTLFDRHRYMWSSALKYLVGIKQSPYDDVNHILDNSGIKFSSNTDKTLVYTSAMVLSGMELALRAPRIWHLFQTAIGNEPNPPEEKSTIDIGTYLSSNTLMMGVKGKWQ
jgi:hypothetical protein